MLIFVITGTVGVMDGEQVLCVIYQMEIPWMACVICLEMFGNGCRMNGMTLIKELQMMEVPGAVFQIALRIPTVISVCSVVPIGAATRSAYRLPIATTLRSRFRATALGGVFPDKRSPDPLIPFAASHAL